MNLKKKKKSNPEVVGKEHRGATSKRGKGERWESPGRKEGGRDAAAHR